MLVANGEYRFSIFFNAEYAVKAGGVVTTFLAFAEMLAAENAAATCLVCRCSVSQLYPFANVSVSQHPDGRVLLCPSSHQWAVIG